MEVTLNLFKVLQLCVLLGGFIFCIVGDAQAAEAILNSGNTAWVLTSTALVLFMTLPGLALFYAGLVQSKNALSVMMHCFAIACLASVLWLVGVYSLAFDEGNAIIGGLGKAMLSGVGKDALSGDIPESVFFMFQMTFAIITPALIIGAYVERIKFSAVLLFSGLWLIIVYAPVCHWVWGGGWLAEKGIMDFAGGLVVHATAGTAAIVFVKALGNRTGFPKHLRPPHNPGMTMIGAAMLWVGWFGFNGGSALAADGNAGMAILVTHVSAAMGALVWVVIEWLKFGKPSLVGIVTGMVAGLATITPASGFVGAVGGLCIGLAGGVVCYYAVNLIKNKLNTDDSLDVFAVHGVGGILGILMVAIFATENFGGVGLADGATMGSQLGVQALGVVATVVWTVVFSWLILIIVKAVCDLRVNDDQITEGLDLSEHGERAYTL